MVTPVIRIASLITLGLILLQVEVCVAEVEPVRRFKVPHFVHSTANLEEVKARAIQKRKFLGIIVADLTLCSRGCSTVSYRTKFTRLLEDMRETAEFIVVDNSLGEQAIKQLVDQGLGSQTLEDAKLVFVDPRGSAYREYFTTTSWSSLAEDRVELRETLDHLKSQQVLHFGAYQGYFPADREKVW